MHRANRSFLAVLGAVALGLTVPSTILAQEDPSETPEPQAEETTQEVTKEMPQTAEQAKAEAEPKAEAESMEQAQPMAEQGESLVDVAKAQGNLTRFVALVEETGLATELAEGGPYTIFAPTDDAFAALEQEQQETPDEAGLRRLVRTHIAVGQWTSEELKGADEITNLLADELKLDWKGQEGESDDTPHRTVDGADVINADILASNGVIHEIDAVLTASPAPEMSASLEKNDDSDPSATETETDDSGAGN